MKATVITGVVCLIVGGVAGTLIRPPVTQTQVVEVERVVEVDKVVEVTKEIAVDRVVERRIVETRPDKTTIVTEEKIADKSVIEEEIEEEVKIVVKEEVKASETLSNATSQQFSVTVVTDITKPDLTSTLLSISYRPVQRLPFSVVITNPATSIRPLIGLSFHF